MEMLPLGPKTGSLSEGRVSFGEPTSQSRDVGHPIARVISADCSGKVKNRRSFNFGFVAAQDDTKRGEDIFVSGVWLIWRCGE
jgi:hypothetical protein